MAVRIFLFIFPFPPFFLEVFFADSNIMCIFATVHYDARIFLFALLRVELEPRKSERAMINHKRLVLSAGFP